MAVQRHTEKFHHRHPTAFHTQHPHNQTMLPPPRTLLRTSVLSKPSTLLLARHATTVAPSSTTTTTAPPTTTTANTEVLDWDAFLQLRRLRRRYNLASSFLTSFVGTSVGMGYLANKEIDVTQTIFGMDPLIMFGLASIGCGAAGWLTGPTLGGAAFKLVKKRWIGQIAEVSAPRSFLLSRCLTCRIAA
jgi:import inner membrane translocase subunit TIM23